MRVARLLLLACAAPFAGCAAEPPPAATLPPSPPATASASPVVTPPPIQVTPDAPFRQSAPPAGPAVTFAPPAVQELHLKSGLRVLLVERHDLPIVSVRVVTTAGAGDLPWAPPGAVSMMGSMLEQGTTSRTALQLSDAFEALGGHHGTWVDWDWGGAAVKVTRDKLDAALSLLSDVVLHPSFPPEELERLRARRLGAIQQEKSSPPAMASNATAAALFGRAHPYGHAIVGQAADVRKLDRADLQRAYAALFSPRTCAIVVAGDLTRDAALAKLEASFGAWTAPQAPALPGGAALRIATPEPPSQGKEPPRLVIVDKPGAPQSVVRFAEVAVPEVAPDRDAIAVMNAIFGGMFSSRINLNLREAHAYTYGASSRFDGRHGKGPFIAAASVKSEATAASIAELFKEERVIQDELVSNDELEGAKEALKLALPARFETVDAVTQALADLVIYHLPLDEFATLPARIDRVTADEVRKAARAHLHPRTLRVVVVGDRARLEPTLEPLHLGPVEGRDAYGDIVTSVPSVTPR